MKVKVGTKYREFEVAEQYLTDASRKELTEAAQKVYGEYWQLTIENFVALSQGDTSMLGNLKDPTVLQVMWLKGLQDFSKMYNDQLLRLQPHKDAQEKAAEAACVKVSAAEGMVVFMREYFGLHSFEEAQQKTLLDFMMAKRDRFNAYIYNKRLADLRAAQHARK